LGEGGSGGKYHCSRAPGDVTPSREDEYPGDIGVPEYRAGLAGSFVKNLGSLKDEPGGNILSLMLARKESRFCCFVDDIDIVASVMLCCGVWCVYLKVKIYAASLAGNKVHSSSVRTNI
jgi:hypothetical protein